MAGIFIPPTSAGVRTGIFAGAFLAFYAFVGFEDRVNIAEEVKHPRRNLPLAILITIVLTTLLYIFISLAAVLSVSPAELATSNTPVAKMVGATTGLVHNNRPRHRQPLNGAKRGAGTDHDGFTGGLWDGEKATGA